MTLQRFLHLSLIPSSLLLTLACNGPTGADPGGTGAGAGLDGKSGSGGTSGGGIDLPVTPTPDEVPGDENQETCVTLEDGTEECYCLSVAVIGTADSAATETNATAFKDWLNTKSNALVTVLDPKDPSAPAPKPTLTAEFLAQYDVIILQLQGDSKDGPFWTYSADEIAALKAWVEGGGGLISLTGYNGNKAAEESAASNQLLSAVAGISYGTQDILGSGAGNLYCWGGSVPVSNWADSPIAYEVTQVGAFHGYPVTGGTAAAYDDALNVVGATADVGDGHVFVWADEWVIFTNQWYAADPNNQQYTDPNNPCYEQRPEQVFQLPQFWYNALSYAGQANQCELKIDEPTIIIR